MSTQSCNMSSQNLEISTKSGCNNLATKRTNKTASINSISKHQRATRFIVWYIVFIMAIIVVQIDAKPAQRHMNKYTTDETNKPRQITKRSHGSSNSPNDWNNPCGGTYDGSKPNAKIDKDSAFRFLRRVTHSAYRTLVNNEKQVINIDDFPAWDKYMSHYKFIPKLTQNSSIALKRWYRNLQTYVAGFSYLYNVQHTFEQTGQNGFAISNELILLMGQAREVLCEIESTINRTSIGHKVKFTPVTQIEMDKRLKFDTRIKNKKEADAVDLKYMKHYFLDFLSTMRYLLKNNKEIKIAQSASESDSGSVSSSEVSTSRSKAIGKKHRLAKNKKRVNKKPKRARIIKNNSLSTA